MELYSSAFWMGTLLSDTPAPDSIPISTFRPPIPLVSPLFLRPASAYLKTLLPLGRRVSFDSFRYAQSKPIEKSAAGSLRSLDTGTRKVVSSVHCRSQ